MKTGKVDVLLGLQWGDEGKGKVVGLNVLKNRVKIRFGEYSKDFELAEIEVNHG